MHNRDLVSKSSRSIAIRYFWLFSLPYHTYFKFISYGDLIFSCSRKLLLSRKRDTVYTRSINGFSLRKSKVLSVGASSLKWSKSIERHSKKANEVSAFIVLKH